MTLEEKIDDLIAAAKKRLLMNYFVSCAALHVRMMDDDEVRGDWIGKLINHAKAACYMVEAARVRDTPSIQFADRWTVLMVAREPAQVWGESSL